MKDGKQYLIGVKLSEKDLNNIENRMSQAMENGMSLDRKGKAIVKKDMETLLGYVRELTSAISSSPPDVAEHLFGHLKNVLPMISGLADKMRQVNDATDWMKQGFTFGEDIYTTIKALDTVQHEVADVKAEVAELTTALNPFLNALKANDPSKFFKKFNDGFKSVGNDASTMRATITKELNAAKSSGNDLKNVINDAQASARNFTNKKAANFVDISSIEEARKEFNLLCQEYEKYGDLSGSIETGEALKYDIERVKDYIRVITELQNLSKNKFGKGLFNSVSSSQENVIFTEDLKYELQDITRSIAATIKEAGDTLQRTVDGLNLKEVQLSVVIPEADAKKVEKQANDWIDKFNEKFKSKPVQLSVDMADPFKTYKSKSGSLTEAQKKKITKAKQEALDALRGIANDETLEANFSGLDDPETSRILKKLADSFTKIRKGVELGQTSILEATKQWRSEIDKLLTLSFKWSKVDVGDGAQELLENLQRVMTDTPMEVNVNTDYFIKQIENAFKKAQFNINGSVVGGTPVSGGAPIILTGTPVFTNSPVTPLAPQEPPKTPPTPQKSSEQPKSEDIAQDAIEIVTKPANALTRAVEKLDAEIESLKEKRRLGYEAVEQRKAAKANADANIKDYNVEKETADAARKIVLDSLIAVAEAAKNADIEEYNSTAKDDKIKVLEGRKAKINKIVEEQGDPSQLVVDAVKDFYINNDNQAKRRLKEITLIDKDLSAKYTEVINLEKEISKLNPATDGNKISELRGKVDAIKPEIDMLFGGVTESVVAEYVALEKQIENAKQRYAQTNSKDDKLTLDGLEKRQKDLKSGLSYLQNEKGVDKAFFEKFKEATDIEREIRSLDPIKDKSKISDLKIQMKKIVAEMGNIFRGLKEKTAKELADVEAQLTEARKKYTLSNSEKDKKVVDQLEAKQKNLATGQKAVGYLENNRIKKQLFEQSGFRDYRGLDINASIQFVNEILRGSTTLADTLTHLSANGVNIKGNILDNLVYFIPRVQEMMGIIAQSSQEWERTDELQQRFLRIADLLQKISGLFSIRGNSATIESLQEFINVFGKVPRLAPVVDAAKNHLDSLLEMSNLVGDNIIYKEILGGNKVNSDLFKMLQGNYIEMPSEIQKELQKAIPSIDFSKLIDKDIDDNLRQAITDKLTAAFKSGGLDSNVFEQLKTGAPALQKFYEVLKLIVLYANQLQTGDALYALTGHGKTGYIGKLQSQIGKDDSMVATVGSGADKKLYGLQTKNQNRYHAIPGTTPKSYDTKDFLGSLGIDKLQYEKFILSQGLFAERDKLQNELAEIMAKEEAEVDKVALQRIQARIDAIDGMLKKSGTTATSEAEAKSRVKEINEQMFANMSLSRPEDVVKQEYGYDQTAYAKAVAEKAKKVAALEKATPEMVEKLNQEIKELDAVLSNREVILEAVRTLYKDRELAEFNSGIAAKNAEKYKGYKSSRQHHRDVLDSTFNKEGDYRDQSGNVQAMSEVRHRFLTALQYNTMDSDVINSLLPDLEEYEEGYAELRSMPEETMMTAGQIAYKDALVARLRELKDRILNVYYQTEGWLLNDLLTREIQSVETRFNAAARGVVNDNSDVNAHFDSLEKEENLRYNKQTQDIQNKYADQIDMSNGLSEVRNAYEQERREIVSGLYGKKIKAFEDQQLQELLKVEGEANKKIMAARKKYKDAQAEHEKNKTEKTKAELDAADKEYGRVLGEEGIKVGTFKKQQEKALKKAKTDNWNEANSEVPNKLEELEQAARNAANQTVEGVVEARKEALRQELTKKVETGELSQEEAETQRLQGFSDIDKQAKNGVIQRAITNARNKANKALENFVKGVAEQYGITADLTEKTLAESIIKGDKSAEQAELDAATTEHNARMDEIAAQRAKAIKEQEDRNAEAVMNNMKNLDEAMEKATSSLQNSNGYWLKDSTIISQIGKGERAGAAKDKKDADAKAREIQGQIDNLMEQGRLTQGMVEGTEQLGEVQRKQTEAMRANATEVEKQTGLAQRSADASKQSADATQSQQQYYTGGFVGGGVAINTNGLAQETTLRGIWQLLNGGPPQGGWGDIQGIVARTVDEILPADRVFADSMSSVFKAYEGIDYETAGAIGKGGLIGKLQQGNARSVPQETWDAALAQAVKEEVLALLHNHPNKINALTWQDVDSGLYNANHNKQVKVFGSVGDKAITSIDFTGIDDTLGQEIVAKYRQLLDDMVNSMSVEDVMTLASIGYGDDRINNLGISKEQRKAQAFDYSDEKRENFGWNKIIGRTPELKETAEMLINNALQMALDKYADAFKQFDLSDMQGFMQSIVKPAQVQVATNVAQSGAQAAVELSKNGTIQKMQSIATNIRKTNPNAEKSDELEAFLNDKNILSDLFGSDEEVSKYIRDNYSIKDAVFALSKSNKETAALYRHYGVGDQQTQEINNALSEFNNRLLEQFKIKNEQMFNSIYEQLSVYYEKYANPDWSSMTRDQENAFIQERDSFVANIGKMYGMSGDDMGASLFRRNLTSHSPVSEHITDFISEYGMPNIMGLDDAKRGITYKTPVKQPVEPVPTQTASEAVQQTVPTDPVDVPVEPVVGGEKRGNDAQKSLVGNFETVRSWVDTFDTGMYKKDGAVAGRMPVQSASRKAIESVDDLIQVAESYWQIMNWFDKNGFSAPQHIIDALSQIKSHLQSNKVSYMDLTGQMYDPGYAMDAIGNLAPDGIPDEKLIYSETVSPTVKINGEVRGYGKAIIGTEVTHRSKNPYKIQVKPDTQPAQEAAGKVAENIVQAGAQAAVDAVKPAEITPNPNAKPVTAKKTAIEDVMDALRAGYKADPKFTEIEGEKLLYDAVGKVNSFRNSKDQTSDQALRNIGNAYIKLKEVLGTKIVEHLGPAIKAKIENIIKSAKFVLDEHGVEIGKVSKGEVITEAMLPFLQPKDERYKPEVGKIIGSVNSPIMMRNGELLQSAFVSARKAKNKAEKDLINEALGIKEEPKETKSSKKSKDGAKAAEAQAAAEAAVTTEQEKQLNLAEQTSKIEEKTAGDLQAQAQAASDANKAKIEPAPIESASGIPQGTGGGLPAFVNTLSQLLNVVAKDSSVQEIIKALGNGIKSTGSGGTQSDDGEKKSLNLSADEALARITAQVNEDYRGAVKTGSLRANANSYSVDFWRQSVEAQKEAEKIQEKINKLEAEGKANTDDYNALIQQRNSILQKQEKITLRINKDTGEITSKVGIENFAVGANAAEKELQHTQGILSQLQEANALQFNPDGSLTSHNQSINDWIKSMQALQVQRDKFASQGTLFDSKNQQVLSQMTAQTAQYRKEIMDLLRVEGKFGGNVVDTFANPQALVAQGEVYNKLLSIATATGKVKMETVKFDDTTNTLSYTVEKGKNQVQDMTLHMNALSGAVSQQVIQTKHVDSAWQAFGKSLKGKWQEVARYLTTFGSIYRVWGTLKQGVGYVKEIDTALTELRKVTDATDREYAQFLQTMSKTAGAVGSTVKELTQSAADWARLGYSMQEAGELAKNTAILMNVSEFEDVNKATDTLISSLQAFKQAGQDVGTFSMEIIDKYNEVGNNYAISTSDLAESLTRSSAALVAANNSLEESIAMTAAANTTIQDPESVGNALKVVSMRIRGVKTELEEAGEDTENVVTNTAKLQEKIMALTNIDGKGGIDILTENGEFKSTYEILLAISKIWKEMDDTSQAALLELVAGKTRGSVVAALFQNGDVLEEAYVSASEASGSAMKELETYLDSIQGKLDLFTNSVQTMWTNLLDSKVVKGFVNLGTTLVNLADKIGVIRLLFMGLTTILMRKSGITSIGQFFKQGAVSAEEASKKLAELKTKYAELEGYKGKKYIRKQDSIKNQMKPYQAIVDGAEKAKKAQDNLAKSQDKLAKLQNGLKYAQAHGYPTKSIKSYEKAIDKAKAKVAKATEEVQKCEIANKKLGQSAAIVFGKLKAGVKGAIKSLASIGKQLLEMYAITAVVDALYWGGEAIVNWFDDMNETAEEAQEELDELKNELGAIESEIDRLNSELETTNESIDELMKKLTLSFTEQEELDRLKAISAELEKQIQFQETLKAAKSTAVNAQAIHATRKYLNETSFGSDKSRNERQEESKTKGEDIGNVAGIAAGVGLSFIPGLQAFAPALIGGLSALGKWIGGLWGSASAGNKYDSEQSVADAIANMKETREGFKADIQEAMSDGDAEAYNEAIEALDTYDAKMADHMSVIAQNANSFDWETATEEQKRQMQEQLNLLDAYNITMESKDAKVNALDRLFGEDAEEVVKAYRDKIKNDIQNGEAVDFQEMIDVTGLDDDIEAVGLTTKDVADYFTQLGNAGEDAVEKIDVSDLVSELAKVESAFESIKSVMEEFRTEGVVSASTLEGMQDEFGILGDVWDNYVETMLSGTASMSEAQAATEALAQQYLDNHANELDQDTKLTYIVNLEKAGVDNAKELVDSYMNNSFLGSSEFQTFKGNAEELIELAKEYGVELEHTQELEDLITAKRARDSAKTTHQNAIVDADTVKYRNKLLQEEKDRILEDPYLKDEYDDVVSAMNKTGKYENYSADDLEEELQRLRAILKQDLQYEYGKEADVIYDKLFQNPEVVPGIEVSQEKLDAAEKEYQTALDKMKLTVAPEIETAESIDELARFETGMKSLSEAYQEYKEEGVVSFGTLSELGDTFISNLGAHGDIQSVKDEYAELIKLMGTSGTSISAIETQIEKLATAYLSTIDANKMIIASEQERQVVIDNLTNMGVKNAEEIVNAKLKAIAEVTEAYGIDVSNYEKAEAAKLAAAISTVYGEEVANSGLVTTLANKYGVDLSNFVGTEAEKVQAAKDAAKEIAKAHRAEQIAELDAGSGADETYKILSERGDPYAAKMAQLMEQKWLRDTQSERDAINDQYQKAIAEIDAITVLDPNDYIKGAFTGKDLNLDFNLGDDFWTGEDSGSDSSTELDWLDHYFTKIENKIKEKEADLENVMSADVGSIDDKNTIIDGIIGLYESKIPLLENAINAYEDRAAALFNGFSSDIQSKILNGSIDINEYDDELAEDIQNYFDYITKVSDLGIELDGVKVTIADFSLQKFDNASTAFDKEIEEKFQSDQDVIEAEIGYLEELGQRVDPKLYEKLIQIQKEEQKVLENKKKTLENILATEIASGRIQIGSEQWYEMTSDINDADEALIASKNDIESFQNSINEIYWDNFEKGISQIEAVDSELSDLFDLFSEDDKVTDEFGNWTDEGIASLGLLAQRMENAKTKADEYSTAIKKLDDDYAAGKYSLDEYNEKMAELKDGQLSEIKNIKDAKDAMVDLNKVRIEAVKEAIDKEIEALEEKNEKLKEELDLEKEQYDFQKQVAEQEKSMADIQRRLNALAGDTSASAIAERRKLQAELAEAQQEMDDMWYEHSIEEQQKSLDESLENYKENKEDEKEALDKWLEEEEKVIQESFDLFNSNVGVVASVLEAFEAEHGIKLSEAIVNPWNSGIDAMEAYRKKLAEMKQEQDDAKESAEDTAEGIIESLDKPQASVPTTSPVVSESTGSTSQSTGDTTPSYREYTVKENDTLSDIAQDELGSASRWQEIYNLNKDVISNPDLIYPGQKIKLPHYAKGTMGAEYDHWAMVDELGPELQLVPDGSGRLSYITRGTSVIPHDLSEKLVDLALDPTKVLEQSRPAIGAPHITTNNFDIDLSFGSLVHVDHCDQNTLPDLQKMVRGEFDNMMKTLNQKIKRK